MDAILLARYPGQVVPVRYHMSWPNSADPYYSFNPTQSYDRRFSYDSTVTFTPTFFFDGQWLKQVDDPSIVTWNDWYAYTRATLDSLFAVPAPVRIKMNQIKDADSVYVAIDVIAEASLGIAPNLFVCYQTTWDREPGKGKYRFIMRRLDPNTVGGTLIGLVNPGDSVHVEYSWFMPAGVNHNRMMVSAWVEAAGHGGVLNAITGDTPVYTVGVPGGEAPVRIVLDQNAPNPFNPTTTIGYSLDRESRVRLSVYSQAGRLVTNLVNSRMPAGSYAVPWNGTDLSGKAVGSGIYYYRLDAEKTSLTNKMILIR